MPIKDGKMDCFYFPDKMMVLKSCKQKFNEEISVWAKRLWEILSTFQ